MLLGAGEGPFAMAEQLGLDQRIGDRSAVHRHEWSWAGGDLVDRAGDDLLAGPGLSLQQDRRVRARDEDDALEVRRQRGREGRKPAARRLQISGAQLVGPARRRLLVKEEERVSELEDGAVGHCTPGGARSVEQRSVLRLVVLDHPGAEDLLQARMDGGDARVRNADSQHSRTVLGGLPGAQGIGASELHRIDPIETESRTRVERLVAAEGEEQIRASLVRRTLSTCPGNGAGRLHPLILRSAGLRFANPGLSSVHALHAHRLPRSHPQEPHRRFPDVSVLLGGRVRERVASRPPRVPRGGRRLARVHRGDRGHA